MDKGLLDFSPCDRQCSIVNEIDGSGDISGPRSQNYRLEEFIQTIWRDTSQAGGRLQAQEQPEDSSTNQKTSKFCKRLHTLGFKCLLELKIKNSQAKEHQDIKAQLEEIKGRRECLAVTWAIANANGKSEDFIDLYFLKTIEKQGEFLSSVTDKSKSHEQNNKKKQNVKNQMKSSVQALQLLDDGRRDEGVKKLFDQSNKKKKVVQDAIKKLERFERSLQEKLTEQ